MPIPQSHILDMVDVHSFSTHFPFSRVNILVTIPECQARGPIFVGIFRFHECRVRSYSNECTTRKLGQYLDQRRNTISKRRQEVLGVTKNPKGEYPLGDGRQILKSWERGTIPFSKDSLGGEFPNFLGNERLGQKKIEYPSPKVTDHFVHFVVSV